MESASPFKTHTLFKYNSNWFQRNSGQHIEALLALLLSVHEKLRTTALLTERGKVMRLLVCHLLGSRMGANLKWWGGIFLPCVIFQQLALWGQRMAICNIKLRQKVSDA